MEIIYQSIMMACMLLLVACAIVFPILFLVQFKQFRKEIIEALNKKKE